MAKCENQYSACHTHIKTIKAVGYTKSQLMQRMKENKILLNELAEKLIASDYFEVSNECYQAKIIEIAVKDLDFVDGATTSQLFSKAANLKLHLCPLELAPYIRLAYLNQKEGYDAHQLKNRAPYGSITVASKIFCEDISVPKGFYLRRIQGDLWLRGYIADEEHVWNPDDYFIFCIDEK
ncbi:helicase [Oceanobacillus neutriphilus]|uniref:Helicase n=1 Tax=Oceanobacillus neutriphilus TaxID=531815 RepID=A0ABQ2NVV2_9BACI|nr:helicase [Oceanobacillus neutriphilus]GGP11846.1 hypothetical protein GCM10011346_25480 [Oceanobacillus neutriphilus]